MNHKDLYINKKTFKCLDGGVSEGYIPKGIDWIKIPEEAEECYYFDGSDPDVPEDLLFYTKDLEATWTGKYWSDNTKCIHPTYQEIKDYVKEHGQLVWKRNVNDVVNDAIDTTINTMDAIHHPKHYTSDDCGVEAIEVTSLLPACISNAVKYVWRCGKKDEDLQELKKALWYINYSIDNDLPSFVDELSDSLGFQELVEKVKSHWVGNKYMFIDAVYWGNQETMKKALEIMILELTSNKDA